MRILSSSSDFHPIYNLSSACLDFIKSDIPEQYRYYSKLHKHWLVHRDYLADLAGHASSLSETVEVDPSIPARVKVDISRAKGYNSRAFKEMENQRKQREQAERIARRNLSDLQMSYVTLWISRNAPDFVLEAVWRAIVKEKHPDVGGNHSEFLRYKQAYETIKEARKKA